MNTLNTKRKDRWEETCQVRFGSIDRSDRLTLASVFNFFQEAATSHAENLGVGRDALAQTKQGWILSRMSVEINERPLYNDYILLRTWPRGVEKLFAIRDYEIRSLGADINNPASHDKPVILARSCWLIIDTEKRRPLRPQAIAEALPHNEGQDALPSGGIGLSEQPNLNKVTELKASYSDLDFYGHVNNVSYIRWIQDALEPGLLEKASRMRMDINYLNEILPGEMVEIWSSQMRQENTDDNSSKIGIYAFEGRKTGSSTAFRAELRLWND